MKPLSGNWSASSPLTFLASITLVLFMRPTSIAVTSPLVSSPAAHGGGSASPVDTASASILQASGVTYYVSTAGSDGNPGTIGAPWRTIQYAVNQVNPGDVIYVRTGTYSGSVHITRSGAKGAPVTLSTYNGEAVTISGGGSPAIRSDGRGQDYWEIRGFTLESTGRYTLEVSNWACFNSSSCTGSKYWGIHNTTIYGAVFINGSRNLFESNEVDGSRHTGDENGVLEAGKNSHHNIYRNNEVHNFNDRGFWSESFTHNGLWEGNHVHDIWSDNFSQGIDMDGYKNVEWSHTIRGNRIEVMSGLAIQLENTYASVVENNVIVSPRRQGIVVINYSACQKGGPNGKYGGNNCVGDITNNILRQNLIYNGTDWGGIISYQAGGIQILGNTIANTNGPSVYLSGRGTTPQIKMRNNILSGGSSGVLMDTLSSLTNVQYNLIYPRGAAAYKVIGGRQYTVAQYRAATGRGQRSIQANPLFVNPSTYDFHLQSGSRAINAGVGFGVKTDLDGTPRPQGPRYDIGAYEYSP